MDAAVGQRAQALVNDADGDGVADETDNCPLFANPDQQDSNAVGPGDACELSFYFSTGLLSRYARFGSHKELVVGLSPLTLSSGPDLMSISATAPSFAFANLSLLSQQLGVRSPLELFPPDSNSINVNEVLQIAIGSSSVLGGAKGADIWLRLEGNATVSVRLLSGSTVVATHSVAHQSTGWRRFSTTGALFDRAEVRVTTGRISIRGGGDGILIALGSAVLPCISGFQRVGGACVDINECAGIGRVCDALTTCTNLVGSYSCGACPSGYRGTGASGCFDVDECQENPSACSPLVTCSNVAGSHLCGACPSGYQGDGRTCADIDECLDQTDACDPLVSCTNTPGAYTCGACPSGYTGGGTTACADVDECSGPARACDPQVTCANLPGTFVCGDCPAGYRGTGSTSCVDIDECSEGSATCVCASPTRVAVP